MSVVPAAAAAWVGEAEIIMNGFAGNRAITIGEYNLTTDVFKIVQQGTKIGFNTKNLKKKTVGPLWAL